MNRVPFSCKKDCFILYPPNTAPPLNSLPLSRIVPFLDVYVDASASCPNISVCNGSVSLPFNSLSQVFAYWARFEGGSGTHGGGGGGGRIYFMPGVYSGQGNTNFTSLGTTVIDMEKWPGKSGEVIFDCGAASFFMYTRRSVITISNITIQNCVQSYAEYGPYGHTGEGGALYVRSSNLTLNNVIFKDNFAHFGGALFANKSVVTINGGAFLNNSASGGGDSVFLTASLVRFGSNLTFSSDSIANGGESVVCSSFSSIQNDGTVSFSEQGCILTLESDSTVAQFPLSLSGVLFPKINGATQFSLFGALEFESIVELDSATGNPIEATRLTKQQLDWTYTTKNQSEFFLFEYDALGPDNQVILIKHSFFLTNGSVLPLGGSSSISVSEGFIKTTIEVALWPFRSPSNSLAVILQATAPQQILSLSKTNVGGQTEFTMLTSQLTLTFSALNFAVYDSVQTVRQDVNVTAALVSNGVSFQLVFSSFDTWVGYDPSFGVILGGQADSGGGGTSLSLIIGLSVGLGVGIPLVAFVILLGILTAGLVTTYLKRKNFAAGTGSIDI